MNDEPMDDDERITVTEDQAKQLAEIQYHKTCERLKIERLFGPKASKETWIRNRFNELMSRGAEAEELELLNQEGNNHE